MCLSLLVLVIDNNILNTALPTLARVLHAGASSLQWITDAYTLCFAALLIPAGALGDRYGRRTSLIGGLIVFALGSVTAAFFTSEPSTAATPSFPPTSSSTSTRRRPRLRGRRRSWSPLRSGPSVTASTRMRNSVGWPLLS